MIFLYAALYWDHFYPNSSYDYIFEIPSLNNAHQCQQCQSLNQHTHYGYK